MKSVKHVKAEDAVEAPAAKSGEGSLDLSPLLGDWVNTNAASQGVARVVLTANGEKLIVRMFEASGSSRRDWGSVEADGVYAASVTSRLASAFSATYGLESKEARLLVNLSLGLLIVAICTTAGDAPKRPESFSREFYRRETGR